MGTMPFTVLPSPVTTFPLGLDIALPPVAVVAAGVCIAVLVLVAVRTRGSSERARALVGFGLLGRTAGRTVAHV